MSARDKKYLKKEVRKRSKQREAILKVLKRTKIHPPAEWIYREVKKEIPSISLGTVYRNINLLQSMGEVSVINCEGNGGRYDGNTLLHYHITCQNCGKISDIEGILFDEIEEKVAEVTGYRVITHCIGFQGICPECNREGNKIL